MIVLVLPDMSMEQQLLSNARQNDQEAQREIYEQYFPPIYQYIRLRIGDRESARDIAAEVFLDFFRALQGNRPPSTNLRAWLFRVARNKIVDHYGRNKQYATETLEEWVPASPENNPEAVFMRSLRLERARDALMQLAPDQQEVLVLRFGQALSLQETADLMGKKVGAIKSLQFRAMDRLRQLLEEEGE